MAIVVNTNMQSMNALSQLNRTTKSLASAFENISSGLKINKAADDAAGSGVSEEVSQRATRHEERPRSEGPVSARPTGRLVDVKA